MKHAVLALALLFAPLTASAQLVVPPEMALDLSVPAPPVAVPANGRRQLVYELHLTNFRSSDVTLERIDVLADACGLRGQARRPAPHEGQACAPVIASHSAPGLAAIVGRPGLRPGTGDKLVLAGGMRAVVFLWVAVDRAPESIAHRVQYRFGDESAVVEGARVAVAGAPVSLAPPLAGDRWVTAYGPTNDAPHRRTMLPLRGAVRIPQRFATDWVRIGPDGVMWHGDPSRNENWYGFGAEVLAVADAVVAEASDDLPDITPPLPPQAPLPLEHAAGNQVVLDLGAARYAFYAHLKSGSVRVKKGDRVRRGQVLGLVGNSGNSMGPHLHFHVADGTTLAAEGLPYVFTEFEVMGRIASSERLEAGEPWRPGAIGTERHRNEMPAGDMVVSLTAADGRSPRATRPAPRR